MASGEDFDRILDACTIAFDGRRADGRLRRGEPAQRSRPRLRGVAQVVCQVATQYVKLVEATHQAGRLGRRGEDRHWEEYKRIIDYSLIQVRRKVDAIRPLHDLAAVASARRSELDRRARGRTSGRPYGTSGRS